MPSKLPRVATDFCSASPGSSMWRKTCIVTESAPRGGRAHAPQRGSCKRTANSERNDEGAAASRFERLELLPCSRSLRRLRIFFDQLLEHQTRVELFAELGEGKALAQQRRADFIALRIAPPDFVELDDRLIELLQTEVALADQVLRVGRKAALRIALQEILEARDRGAIVLFLKRAPAALEIPARGVGLRQRQIDVSAFHLGALLSLLLERIAQLLELVFARLEQIGLHFGVGFELGEARFHILHALVAVLARLADLPSDLDAGLVDALLDRAQIALHLLDVRARVGQRRAKALDIGAQRVHVAAHAPLLALEQIDLLRIDAGGKAGAEQQRGKSRNNNRMLHGIAPARKSSGPGGSRSGRGDFFSSNLHCAPGRPGSPRRS